MEKNGSTMEPINLPYLYPVPPRNVPKVRDNSFASQIINQPKNTQKWKIGTIETPAKVPQNKTPHYLKAIQTPKSAIKQIESDPFPFPAQNISRRRAFTTRDAFSQSKRQKEPHTYISWKYIGESNGTFGSFTGKFDVNQVGRSNVTQKLSDIPFELDKTHFNTQEKEEKDTKIVARNLFLMSINNNTYKHKKKLPKTKKDKEEQYQLYLDNGKKLIPLVPSHLKTE